VTKKLKLHVHKLSTIEYTFQSNVFKVLNFW